MDLSLLIFFTILGFLCMMFSRLLRRSGLGAGIGVIGMMLFMMLGFTIGGGEQQITSLQIISDNATHVPLEMGVSTSDLSIIFFSLALITMFIGVLE